MSWAGLCSCEFPEAICLARVRELLGCVAKPPNRRDLNLVGSDVADDLVEMFLTNGSCGTDTGRALCRVLIAMKPL
jgi:hypothetical protein